MGLNERKRKKLQFSKQVVSNDWKKNNLRFKTNKYIQLRIKTEPARAGKSETIWQNNQQVDKKWKTRIITKLLKKLLSISLKPLVLKSNYSITLKRLIGGPLIPFKIATKYQNNKDAYITFKKSSCAKMTKKTAETEYRCQFAARDKNALENEQICSNTNFSRNF